MNSAFKIITDPQTGQQIWESNTHNIQTQYSDIGSGNYFKALEYVIIENDWRLPSLEELKILYNELHTLGHGNFQSGMYWSSFHFKEAKLARRFNFSSGNRDLSVPWTTYGNIRLVR
jgi:hypothetical protein